MVIYFKWAQGFCIEEIFSSLFLICLPWDRKDDRDSNNSNDNNNNTYNNDNKNARFSHLLKDEINNFN